MIQAQKAPSDLEIRVRIHHDHGKTRLSYELHSPTGVAPFSHLEIAGPTFRGSPDEFQRSLIQQIEELNKGIDVDGALVLSSEVSRKLDGIGRDLWEQLFTAEMKQAYRNFRNSIRTLRIISDEPWIPWEMIKPYDGRGEPLDDDFLAARFELTRWLVGNSPAPDTIAVRAFAVLGQDGSLPLDKTERDLVMGLCRYRPGLRNASPSVANLSGLLASLQEGGIGLLHFVGHGAFDSAYPNEAGFAFADGSSFRPSDLHGPLQTRLERDRPLVFLNVCESGRQGWSWTGLAGWADRWVGTCGCGAFLGPQWKVRDSVAFAFAKGLYEALLRGETLGRAAREGRQSARNAAPFDPGWLAYVVYGHPKAQVLFGEEASSIVPSAVQPGPREEPLVTSASPSVKANNPVVQSSHPPEPVAARKKPASATSGSLRIKRSFSDRDRDQFIDGSFDYIADFFANSLTELQQQNPGIETRFRRVDQNHFTATVYRDGEKESACRIWRDQGHIGDIAYADGDTGLPNSYNEALSVQDDGYSLLLRPLGLRLFTSTERKLLTQDEAAEYLWSMLFDRLR